MDALEVKLAEVTDQEQVAALEGQLAGMSDRAVEQVEQHLDGAAVLRSDDVQHEIDRANQADAALQEAQQHAHEQQTRLDEGDYAGARDMADARAYEISIADDQGATVDRPWVQAQHDAAALSWSAHEQTIVDDHVASAASYHQAGDDDHAAQYSDAASHHADRAASHADDATHHDTDSSDSSAVDTTQTDG